MLRALRNRTARQRALERSGLRSCEGRTPMPGARLVEAQVLTDGRTTWPIGAADLSLQHDGRTLLAISADNTFASDQIIAIERVAVAATDALGLHGAAAIDLVLPAGGGEPRTPTRVTLRIDQVMELAGERTTVQRLDVPSAPGLRIEAATLEGDTVPTHVGPRDLSARRRA